VERLLLRVKEITAEVLLQTTRRNAAAAEAEAQVLWVLQEQVRPAVQVAPVLPTRFPVVLQHTGVVEVEVHLIMPLVVLQREAGVLEDKMEMVWLVQQIEEAGVEEAARKQQPAAMEAMVEAVSSLLATQLLQPLLPDNMAMPEFLTDLTII
jgi:hypothetical protein